MYARPPKASHLETIQYEIDMLDFCYQRLQEQQSRWLNEGDFYVYLECFLLHFRNLIEFFGNETDLKVSEYDVWAGGKTLSQEEIASITNRKLCKKYRGPISQYLQHCTKGRADKDRGWDVRGMYKQISRTIKNFWKLFSDHPHVRRVGASRSTSLDDSHTASVQRYGETEKT